MDSDVLRCTAARKADVARRAPPQFLNHHQLDAIGEGELSHLRQFG
jgi:hypothetical protein